VTDLRRLAPAILLVVALAGCGSTKTVVRTVTVAALLGGGADQTAYGRVASIEPAKGGYFVHFDPASWLTGITANVAFAQSLNQTCAPRACAPVPNDYFVVDDGHTQLTYFMPRTTSGTVLTRSLSFPGTVVSADRLARLVAQGTKAPLYEPLDSGVWLRLHGDTITRFAQQYRP
jgi:hypothetical protein